MNIAITLVTSVISCAVSFCLGGVLAFASGKWKGMRKRERALEEGVKSLLRSTLIDCHDKYSARGYCPIYIKDASRRSYEAYHDLGGNGVVTKLFEDIMALPEEP